MNHLRPIVAALLSAVALTAQAAPTPTFTLAAGYHDLAALVELTGQVCGRPVSVDDQTRETLGRKTVVVQRELRLAPDAFVDVATTLLHDRGYVLTSGKRGHRVLSQQAAFAADASVERTPAEILADASGIEYVTTTAASDDPVVHMNALRPLFGWGGPDSLDMQLGEDELYLTGTSDKVRCALKVLALLHGEQSAPTTRPQFAADTTLAWPGGTMTARTFIAKFATALDANVIGELCDVDLALGKRADVTPIEWYSRATQALFAADLVLFPSAGSERLFTLRSLHDVRSRQFVWQANHVPCDQLAAAD